MSQTKTPPRSRTSKRKRTAPAERRAPAPVVTGGKLAGLCVLLAVATVAVYSAAISHGFLVLDDREYVTANTHIRGLGWTNIKWAFTSMAAANWHPLTWLSHALDYQLFALHPWGHHLDNVVIHALNAVLLFLLLRWMTKRPWPSLFVAALFALHPINVESVAWVAERKNVLSTLFFLLTLGAYTWYAQKPGWRRYLLVAALFAASLMAKPMGVTLPFVLLLLDYWPLERIAFRSSLFALRQNASSDISGEKRKANGEQRFLRLLLEKLPLLALSAASSWMTLKAQHAVVQTLEEFSIASRVQNAVVAYGLYLWKTIWPAQLALYPHALGALPAWQWLLSASVLIAITAAVLRFRSRHYLPVGWFWFLGTLVPVLGLVQVGEYAMADRYAYIPLIGIFIMIAWGIADLAAAKSVRPAWCAAAAAFVLAALGAVTVHQIAYWQSDYDLLAHALEVKESPFAHNAVGMTLMNPGSEMSRADLEGFPSEPARIDAARGHFERALELREATPDASTSLWDKARTLNNLGNLDRMQNRLDEAREHDEAALKIYRQLAQQNPDAYLPYLAVTLNNLGAVERSQNHLDDARNYYEESLRLNRQLAQSDPAKYLPNEALILNEYGLVDASQNRPEAARAHYEEALRIHRQLAAQSPDVYLPQLAVTLTNFGLFEAYQRHMDDAHAHLEEALEIQRKLVQQNSPVYLPELTMTLTNLGHVERLQSRISDARAHYEEAYALLQKLMQGNSAYANQMRQLEASLQELEHMSPAQQTANPGR